MVDATVLNPKAKGLKELIRQEEITELKPEDSSSLRAVRPLQDRNHGLPGDIAIEHDDISLVQFHRA